MENYELIAGTLIITVDRFFTIGLLPRILSEILLELLLVDAESIESIELVKVK
jgi:hypothetical protein